MKSQLLSRIGRVLFLLLVLGLLQASAHVAWNYNVVEGAGRANDTQECRTHGYPISVVTANGEHYSERGIYADVYDPSGDSSDMYITQNGERLAKMSDKDYSYNQFCARVQTRHWYDYYPHTWQGWVGTHIVGFVMLVVVTLVLAVLGFIGFLAYRFIMYGPDHILE